MPVRITCSKPAKYRPHAARFSNEDIHAIALIIKALQVSGIVTSRDLAVRLNGDGVLCAAAPRWSATMVYLILKRGRAMGLPFTIRNRSDAASSRRVIRRSKDVIAAERKTAFKALVSATATKTAITAEVGAKGSRHGE